MAYLTFAKTILASLFSKPATRLYPFVKRAAYANTRGSISIDINACTMCTLCQKKCPTNALAVNRTERIWAIERMKCIQCGACVDVCPKKCLTMETAYTPPSVDKKTDSFKQDKPPQAAAAAPAPATVA